MTWAELQEPPTRSAKPSFGLGLRQYRRFKAARPAPRGRQPPLREGPEPDAGGGHYRAQDIADVEATYSLAG